MYYTHVCIKKYEDTQLSLQAFQIKQGFTNTVRDMNLVSPKEARCMLGVYTAPDGNLNLQYDILIKKSKKCKQAIYSNLQTFDTFLVQAIYKYGTILM